uniref:Uncharacterized protein n=1 Tax=Araneus ventricosus TaxID=182803 RepID=A0A4Y2V5E3_ARAVE|nr:hypothetical protein AVEN_212599-1 [Araneus ventricosus]
MHTRLCSLPDEAKSKTWNIVGMCKKVKKKILSQNTYYSTDSIHYLMKLNPKRDILWEYIRKSRRRFFPKYILDSVHYLTKLNPKNDILWEYARKSRRRHFSKILPCCATKPLEWVILTISLKKISYR